MESMSLIKYLRIYYGVNISKKNEKLTHNLIKKNMPFVKRCDFDYSLSNRDMLMCGEIVMVYDDTGAVLPYSTRREVCYLLSRNRGNRKITSRIYATGRS